MVIAAAAMLVLALVPVARLVIELPPGSIRRGWHWLAGLLVAMVFSCLAAGAGLTRTLPALEQLLIPSLLILGSWFILIVSHLSRDSVAELRKVSALMQENITDSLTGIHNRRHFDQTLRVEMARSRRYGSPLSLMLLDLDHFKQVNDRYGHDVGDRVLRAAARHILALSRGTDIVARYGGEELAIIAPATVLEEARQQAERMRQELAGQLLAIETAQGLRRVRVTVSIGVAELGAADAGPEGLVRRADAALYTAKQAGRDQVFPLHPKVTPLRPVRTRVA